MRSARGRVVLGASLLIAGSAIGCGSAVPSEPAELVLVGDPTTIPTAFATVAPTATSTAVATATPVPTARAEATATALASPTPDATATPVPIPTPGPTATPEPISSPDDVGSTPVPGAGVDNPGAGGGSGSPRLDRALDNLAVRGPGVTMPDLSCVDLQRAENVLQALTGEFFASDSVDASGEGRRQLFDRNWQVVDQVPDAGELIQGDPLLRVLKDDETTCRGEPEQAMFDLRCMNLQQAQDVLQAQTGDFIASNSIDAGGQGRLQINDRSWLVIDHEPPAGEGLADNAELLVLPRDEVDLC